MNFYLHYLGDYARDTKGLSVIEHGAYRLLLDHVYATEQRLPDDKAELYRIVGAMTPAERKAVDKVADRFFPVNGDGRRHNKRAEVEIARAQEKSDKARASAERRWGGKTDADAEPMRTHSRGNANQNQKPDESNLFPADAGNARGAAATVPDCPHQKLIDLYHELLPTCTRVVEWNEERQRIMRSRWREKATSKAKNWGYSNEEQGLACWRKFFAWCAQSDFLTGRAKGRDGGAPFVATLEWLVRPKNFAKVVEGNYHRD
jgi:uncharacterized protein YdaU (DUF1376 family)